MNGYRCVSSACEIDLFGLAAIPVVGPVFVIGTLLLLPGIPGLLRRTEQQQAAAD